jgi:hypothetical protein
MKNDIIDSFIDTIGKYFETHEDAKILEIGKGALAYLCGIGMTSTEAICQGIALETVSVQDLRGKIIVKREGFIKWIKLRLQVKLQELDNQNAEAYAKQESYGPDRELDYLLRRKQTVLKSIEEKKHAIPQLQKDIHDLEIEDNKLNRPEEPSKEETEVEEESDFILDPDTGKKYYLATDGTYEER